MSLFQAPLSCLNRAVSLVKTSSMKRFFRRRHKSRVKSPSSAEAGESPTGDGEQTTGGGEWDHPRKHERGQRPGPGSTGESPDLSDSVVSQDHRDPLEDTIDASGPGTVTAQEHRWFDAVREQNLEVVDSMLLSEDFCVDTLDSHGWSALHLCAWNDYSDLFELLLRWKADVDIRAGLSEVGCTPLALACQRGHTGIVRRLLDASCDADSACTLADSTNVRALHLAAQHGHEQAVKALIGAGATVNAPMCVRGIDGLTALHLAVQNDHLDIMDILIAAGCDVQSSTTPNTGTSDAQSTADQVDSEQPQESSC